MQTAKVIPLNVVRPDAVETNAELAAIDELTARLEHAGYMAVMQIGEPRLSELAGKYKAKGYDVELVPLVEEDTSAAGGCGSASSCSSASSSCGSGGGCGSGPAAPQPAPRGPRTVIRDISLIYIRMPG